MFKKIIFFNLLFLPMLITSNQVVKNGKLLVDMDVALTAIGGVTLGNIISSKANMDTSFYTSIIGFAAAELALISGKEIYKYFKKPAKANTQIAIIEVGDLMSSDKYLTKLEKVLVDKNIGGVLLKVNSTGGAAGASEVLYRELLRVRQTKPIVVFVENSCCSGAYLISCAADAIVAPLMAEIGSIGVLLAIEKIHSPRSPKKEHVDIDFVFAGKDKLIKHPYGPDMSPEQREKMQGQIDSDYEFFCQAVSENRKLPLSSREEWADAQTFNGADAQKLGLCDYIGGMAEARQAAKNLVKERIKDATEQIDFIILN